MTLQQKMSGTMYTLLAALIIGANSTALHLPFAATMSPLWLSAIALFGGGAILLIYSGLRKDLVGQWGMLWQHRSSILKLSLLGTAMPIATLIVAQAHLSAITGGFLALLQFPAGVVLGYVLLREPIKQAGQLTATLAGSAIMVLPGLLQAGESEWWWSLLMLASGCGFGYSFVAAKSISAIEPLTAAGVRQCLAGLALLIFNLLIFRGQIMRAPLMGWDIVGLGLYIIVEFSALFAVIQLALNRLRVEEYTLYMQTTPLWATVAALIVLHETLNVWQIVGGALILGGLFLPSLVKRIRKK